MSVHTVTRNKPNGTCQSELIPHAVGNYYLKHSWEYFMRTNMHNLRGAKPGGFQTRVFPTFFGKGPDCVADLFGTVPRRCS